MNLGVFLLRGKHKKILGDVIHIVLIKMMDYHSLRKWLSKTDCSNFIGLSSVIPCHRIHSPFPEIVGLPRTGSAISAKDAKVIKVSPDYFL